VKFPARTEFTLDLIGRSRPLADVTFLRKRTLLTRRKADDSVVQIELLDRLRTELLLESLQRFFEIRTDSRLRNERASGF
jgi:hypothetical protein